MFNEHSVEDVAEIQEKARNAAYSTKYLSHLPIKKDELVLVRFIDTERLTFYKHWVKDPVLNDGKGAYRNLTCARDGCPICAIKSKFSKPSWSGAYRVIQMDDPAGPRMRVFCKGVNAMTLLDKKQKRLKEQGRDINQADCEIDRSGDGPKTIYTFDFKEPTPAIEAYEYPENIDLEDFFKIDMEALVRIAQTLATAAPAVSPPASPPARPPVTPPAAATGATPSVTGAAPPATGAVPPATGATPSVTGTPDSTTGEDPPF